ncbi:F-box protein [Striga hermonthica]|uniref:F-box protein n=1 Tax=Striga hermonthica TaxID=68872 RepID=A0A9N7RN91_STRHE|nr:F-box protein [Striga hermonthica]
MVRRDRRPRTRKRSRTLTNITRREDQRLEREERDLPPEVLALVISRLNLRGNIRASAVSTRWLAAAISIRQVKSPPLLMHIPKRGDFYEFYDPSSSTSYVLEIPEIRGSRVLYSRNGWLLLNNPISLDLFFYCPFIRCTHPIPQPWDTIMPLTTAFTAAPLSANCIVFSLFQTRSTITVAVWRHGWTEWKSNTFPRPLQYFYSPWVQIAYSRGCFYCLSLEGQLGVFEPNSFAWSIHYIMAPVCGGLVGENPWEARFMAELEGEVYVVCTGPGPAPVVYRVGSEEGNEWLPVRSLEGVALFANDLTSLARADVGTPTAGRIVFSKVKFHGAKCVMYSPGQGRYYPDAKMKLDWRREEPYRSIWIDVPEINPEFRGIELGSPDGDDAAAGGGDE